MRVASWAARPSGALSIGTWGPRSHRNDAQAHALPAPALPTGCQPGLAPMFWKLNWSRETTSWEGGLGCCICLLVRARTSVNLS